MNIMLMFFIISSIILSIQLKKSKMYIANSFYIFSFVILLCIISIGTNNVFINRIIELIISKQKYELIHNGVSNVDYIFSYLFILVVMITLQVYLSFIMIKREKNNNDNKKTERKEYKEKNKQILKQSCNKNKVDNNLSLDRVFIDYGKMIN